MASAVKHIVQLVQIDGKGAGEGDDAATNGKPSSIPTIPAGRKIVFDVQATCEGAPAEVTVEKYDFESAFFIDSNGYKIHLLGTSVPRYITTLPEPQNPIAFFNIGIPETNQTVNATATAFSEPCGTFDASGHATFRVARLFYGELNLFSSAILKSFVVTRNLDFGLGNRFGDPGFQVRATATPLQTGHFGVIQLHKGSMSYQLAGWPADRWQNLYKQDEYVLDIAQGQEDPISQRAYFGINRVTTIKFEDAPTISIASLLEEDATKAVAAVKQDCQFQSYFMFNPSSQENPNADPNAVWYPVQVIAWQINGQAVWKSARRRDDPDAWTIQELAPPAKQALSLNFPTWNSVMQRQ